MDAPLTLTSIISNAFNKDYTADHAVEDLTRLMNEATLVELRHGTDSPRHAELQRLTTIQEKLVKAKLEGHPSGHQVKAGDPAKNRGWASTGRPARETYDMARGRTSVSHTWTMGVGHTNHGGNPDEKQFFSIIPACRNRPRRVCLKPVW